LKLLIINGPNLNLLGKREISIYGNLSFEDFFEKLIIKYSDIELQYFQSNSEGEIIDMLHKSNLLFDGIILNAAAYTHTSIAIADAVSGIETKVVEVHISNVFNREKFRHKSYLSKVCCGTITGFGLNSYILAIENFLLNS